MLIRNTVFICMLCITQLLLPTEVTQSGKEQKIGIQALKYAPVLQQWTTHINAGVNWQLPIVLCELIAEYARGPMWKTICSFPVPPSTACAYIPTTQAGPLVALGQISPYNIALVSYDTGKIIKQLRGHSGTIPGYGLQYSPLHSLLISASCDGFVRFWRIVKNNPRRSTHYKTRSLRASHIKISPDGNLLLLMSGYFTTRIEILSLPQLRTVNVITIEGNGVNNAVWCSPHNALWMHSSIYDINPGLKGTKILQLDLSQNAVTELSSFEKPYPSSCTSLPWHNHIFYCAQNGIVVARPLNGRVISEQIIPYLAPGPETLISSPQQKYVACLGKFQETSSYKGLLTIINTSSYEISETDIPEESLYPWGPVCFFSDTVMFALGRNATSIGQHSDTLYTIVPELRVET